jgi:hypothetical protein
MHSDHFQPGCKDMRDALALPSARCRSDPNHVGLTRADVLLAPVLVGDVHRARLDHADVVQLAAFAALNRV